MKARAALLTLLLVGFGAAVWFDVRAVARLRALSASSNDLASRYDHVSRQLRSVMGEFGQVKAADQVTRARAKVSPAANSTDPKRTKLDFRELIASDPALRSKDVELYRSSLDQRYGLFYHLLGLSPAAQERFKDLLAQIEDNQLQAAAVAAQRGLDTDDPEIKDLRAQLDRPDQSELRQLLGPGGKATLRQYNQDSAAVDVVVDLAGNLPTPSLTDAQAQQLLPVLAAASQKNANGAMVSGTVNVDQVLAQASGFLNPEQILTLSAVLQKSEAQNQINQFSHSP